MCSVNIYDAWSVFMIKKLNSYEIIASYEKTFFVSYEIL